jgi:hypothetical protein
MRAAHGKKPDSEESGSGFLIFELSAISYQLSAATQPIGGFPHESRSNCPLENCLCVECAYHVGSPETSPNLLILRKTPAL